MIFFLKDENDALYKNLDLRLQSAVVVGGCDKQVSENQCSNIFLSFWCYGARQKGKIVLANLCLVMQVLKSIMISTEQNASLDGTFSKLYHFSVGSTEANDQYI